MRARSGIALEVAWRPQQKNPRQFRKMRQNCASFVPEIAIRSSIKSLQPSGESPSRDETREGDCKSGCFKKVIMVSRAFAVIFTKRTPLQNPTQRLGKHRSCHHHRHHHRRHHRRRWCQSHLRLLGRPNIESKRKTQTPRKSVSVVIHTSLRNKQAFSVCSENNHYLEALPRGAQNRFARARPLEVYPRGSWSTPTGSQSLLGRLLQSRKRTRGPRSRWSPH